MSYVTGEPPGTQWLKRRSAPQAPTSEHFDAAMRDLKLTPQEQYLYQHHLNNLYGSGKVWNPDGSTSTVLQMTTTHNGRAYSFPSVWDGQELNGADAMKRAGAVGWDKWPSYATEQEAQARYDKMHEYMEKDLGDWRRNVMDAWQ